jgi:cell division protein FtsL
MRAPASSPSRRSRRPRLRVIRRRSRKLILRKGTRRVAPYTIGAAILVLGIVFTVLLEQVVLAQSAFKLAELRQELVAAENRHQELLLEATRLGNTERIERIAREELGMVDAESAATNFLYADIVDEDTPGEAGKVAERTPPGTGSAAAEAGGSSP